MFKAASSASLPVMTRVWARVRVSVRAVGKFSSGAIVLEPCTVFNIYNEDKRKEKYLRSCRGSELEIYCEIG